MLLSKYNPNWVNDFNAIKRKIQEVLVNIDHSFEHVGSTSVPNLDSKPIIDIDIVFYTGKDFETIKFRLEKLGYYHNGNQGIIDREVFKRNGKLSDSVLDIVQHHLYVCPAYSKALERHVLSRNFLQKNEWAREKYQSLKYSLAEMANQNKKVYAQLKEDHVNSFIDLMVEEELKNLKKK